MARRQEQIVFFAADDQLTYGEVSAVLSDLLKEESSAQRGFAHKKQIGVERKFDWTQLPQLPLRAFVLAGLPLRIAAVYPQKQSARTKARHSISIPCSPF
jgi:hypothetical protein